ncbi:hypothetical protein quinque_000203 [Culex quinquefasciatus]
MFQAGSEGVGGSVPVRGHTTAKVDGAGGQAGSKPRKEPRRKINFLKCILSATIFRCWKISGPPAEESLSPTAGFAMGLQSGPGVTEAMAKSPDYNRNHIQAGSKRRPGDSSATTDSSRRQDINRINNNYPPPAAAVSPFSSLSGNESSLVSRGQSKTVRTLKTHHHQAELPFVCKPEKGRRGRNIIDSNHI